MRGTELPREGQIVKMHVRRATPEGRKAHDVVCVILARSPQGVLVRDGFKTPHVYPASRILSFTHYIPGETDGPLFSATDMHDHVRQSGRPPVDMIQNPSPRESSY